MILASEGDTYSIAAPNGLGGSVQSCARAGGAPDGHFERTKPISCLFSFVFKNDKAKFPVPGEPWVTRVLGLAYGGETGA